MYFSGKITHTVISYLESQACDLEGLFDLTDLSAEFLRDPTCWLEAVKVENFLQQVDQKFGLQVSDHFLMTVVGENNHELRSWGVLDSVLKMMQKPEDIYSQPQRIFSYFVSPAPPVGQLKLSPSSVSFEFPMTDQEYPFVVEFLRASFESIPKYAGKEKASKTTSIQINTSVKKL